jgi:hypothetical protein
MNTTTEGTMISNISNIDKENQEVELKLFGAPFGEISPRFYVALWSRGRISVEGSTDLALTQNSRRLIRRLAHEALEA